MKYKIVQIRSHAMADDPARRTREPTDPIALLEKSDRRRAMLKLLMGAAVSGVAGYVSYPWVAGGRQREFVDGVKSVWRQLQDSGGPIPPSEDVAETNTLPVALDAMGREYESFLANLNLRHIQPMELLRSHFKMRGSVRNELPSRDLWMSMAPTVRVADELRERLGVRLLAIASAYRSPAYNATCPGAAAHSYHMRNMALDLVFDCKPEEVVKAAETLRAGGFFAGGIGRYPNFTHIDTRGQSVDWG
jgi:hypothetical protein